MASTLPLPSFNLEGVTNTALVAGVLNTLYLNKNEYRGDTAVVFCAGVWAATVGGGIYNGFDTKSSISLASIGLAVYLGTMIALAVAYRLSPLHPLHKYPGPFVNKITSLVMLKMVSTGKRFEIIKGWHAKYGKFVRTGPNTLSIASVEAVHPIYAERSAFDKSNAYRPGRAPVGGLFFSTKKDIHNLRRKAWAGAFSAKSIVGLIEVVEKRTDQMIQVMDRNRQKDGSIDMSEIIRFWAYDLMAEMTFGPTSDVELMAKGDPTDVSEGAQNATVVFEVLGEAPSLFDIAWNLPAAKEFHILEDTATKLMDIRKNTTGDDIASYLLGEKGGERLGDEDLNIDSAFAIAAGSDTTGGTLTILLFYLLRDRTVYNKLREELDAHYSSPEEIVDGKVLQELPYLYGTVWEGLRLGTPFGGLPRVVPQGGAMIDGDFIPEDIIVSVPPYTQQTDEAHFRPRPMEFLPERWSPNGLGPDTHTDMKAMLCFSYGAFSCLGRIFALQELHLTVAKLMLQYDMDIPKDYDQQKFLDGILNMRTTLFAHPLKITATPRR
ncbi:cytochrome P450 [Cylindrobasidium torrendii FP15055 ss-10]|uniref:Cytochrome P450 n=1 Tax=Cylindrobasidium torrendii FP15055 ss-10 TaxID=1314674 RepID=A0A0D7BGE1_9AGAR|nr:cytochrome P450 [Cylindrobasidium torrendii FP15055 ss-10]